MYPYPCLLFFFLLFFFLWRIFTHTSVCFWRKSIPCGGALPLPFSIRSPPATSFPHRLMACSLSSHYVLHSPGPCVESLINHPVCRPALSIGAEWPLFHHWCLLHVNKRAMVSSTSASSSCLGQTEQKAHSYSENLHKNETVSHLLHSECRRREEGWVIGKGAARSGAGDWGRLRHSEVDERACLCSPEQLSSGQVSVMYH